MLLKVLYLKQFNLIIFIIVDNKDYLINKDLKLKELTLRKEAREILYKIRIFIDNYTL